MDQRRRLPVWREPMFPRFASFEDFFRFPNLWEEEWPDFRKAAANVYETDKDVVVEVAAPGVKAQDIVISAHDTTLTISGESKEEAAEEKKNYYHRELRYGSFSQSIDLPSAVKADKAEAQLTNGMLKVTLPKSEEAKAKAIKVKVE